MATPPPLGPQQPPGAPFAPPGQPHPYRPQPQAYPYPALNPPPPVNGLAITALTLGALCFLPGVGLVFGIVALTQIRRRGERGKGMAVAGIVLSTVGALLLTLALATGGARDAWNGFRDAASSAGTTFTVEKGECFDAPSGSLEGYAYDVDTVPCEGEHDAEVFANVPMPDGDYPGDDAVTDVANEKCYDLSDRYAMDSWAFPAYVDVYYFTPTRQSWRYGDRQITCMFGNADAEAGLTGSLRQDETTLDADQYAFLEADAFLNDAYDAIPDTEYVEDDLPAHKEWAPKVVDALEQQTAALRAHDWDLGAEPAVTDYAKALDQAREEWQEAADAADAETFSEHWDKAYRLTDGPKVVTAREALGLATTPPAYDDEGTDEGGSGGGGGDDSGVEV
ncbi:DUF4190 domain-containing protein [Streptomyces sp. NPDC002643]